MWIGLNSTSFNSSDLGVPLGSVCIGVAGIQNAGVHAGQSGGNFKVEVRNGLGGSVVDVAVEDAVDDTAGILNRGQG